MTSIAFIIALGVIWQHDTRIKQQKQELIRSFYASQHPEISPGSKYYIEIEQKWQSLSNKEKASVLNNTHFRKAFDSIDKQWQGFGTILIFKSKTLQTQYRNMRDKDLIIYLLILSKT